jgi:hypothetical protein
MVRRDFLRPRAVWSGIDERRHKYRRIDDNSSIERRALPAKM